jgi:TolA-binding protein
MGRGVAITLFILLAAAAGFFAGYARWGKEAAQVQQVEQRLETTHSEVTTLRDQKQDLEQRLQQVTKEQERLAQENEVLRKQQTTEQLVTGKGGELPALPPK